MEHRAVMGRRFKNSHLLVGQDKSAESRKGLEKPTQSKISCETVTALLVPWIFPLPSSPVALSRDTWSKYSSKNAHSFRMTKGLPAIVSYF